MRRLWRGPDAKRAPQMGWKVKLGSRERCLFRQHDKPPHRRKTIVGPVIVEEIQQSVKLRVVGIGRCSRRCQLHFSRLLVAGPSGLRRFPGRQRWRHRPCCRNGLRNAAWRDAAGRGRGCNSWERGSSYEARGLEAICRHWWLLLRRLDEAALRCRSCRGLRRYSRIRDDVGLVLFMKNQHKKAVRRRNLVAVYE